MWTRRTDLDLLGLEGGEFGENVFLVLCRDPAREQSADFLRAGSRRAGQFSRTAEPVASPHSKTRKEDAYLLVCDAFPRVVHELLHRREVHLLVELLQDLVALFQPIQDILLDQRELDRLNLLKVPSARASQGRTGARR